MKGYIKTDDRGQVGIGTLIVFIALVLVAAIAAGVLINTAGFLQTQAEQTGEDSTSQVANNINVIGEVGDVNSASDGINVTRLTVQRSPGSDDVDLSELSIQYVGDNGFANYIYAGAKGTDSDDVDNPYFVEVITAASDTDAVMTQDSDRYQIVIPFATADNSSVNDVNGNVGNDVTPADIDSDLGTGEEAELEITTADRATRNAFIQVPDTIEDGTTSVTL
jgi:flagellin FlaB